MRNTNTYVGKHDAAARTKPREERRSNPPRRAAEPPRRSRNAKRKRTKRGHSLGVWIVAVLVLVFLVAAGMTIRGLARGDGLKGVWRLDDATAYEFDGKGNGTLRLPLDSYAFSYTVEYNVVTLDFEDPAVTDASYSFLRDGKSLTLDTNTGTVYQLEKEKQA